MDDRLYLIVEGEGEARAAPRLVERLWYEYLYTEPHQHLTLPPIETYNAKGNGNITTPGGLERMLEVTRRSLGCRGVLVLLDTEAQYHECPPHLWRSAWLHVRAR